MNYNLIIGLSILSFILSYFLLSTLISLSKKFNFVDKPDGKRKLQINPISKVGGISILVILIASSLLIKILFAQFLNYQLFTILLPLILATFLGLWDDIKSINPWIRLILQSNIGIIAWLFGTKINVFQSETLNFILQIFWFLLLINGTNLIDNSDGLSASITSVSLTFSLLISFYLDQNLVFILIAILLSSNFSFLLLNWNPAKVYLGDSGSYLLGTSVALVLIKLRPENLDPIYSILVVFFLAFVPIIDTTFVVFNRIRKGIHPFTAGRDHLSHILQKSGFGIKKSVLVLVSIQTLTSLLGCLLLFLNTD